MSHRFDALVKLNVMELFDKPMLEMFVELYVCPYFAKTWRQPTQVFLKVNTMLPWAPT